MLEKGDFIEISYTAETDGIIFDTTDKEVAKNSGIRPEHAHPIIICLGHGFILAGLEKELVGKNVGEKSVISLDARNAFGMKNPKLIQLVPLSVFKQHNVQPAQNMQINIDGALGIVKSVSSGRVVVDFNHPLSGKNVVYQVEIKRKIENKVEQVKAILHMFGITEEIVSGVSYDDKKDMVNIVMKDAVPQDATIPLAKKINEMVKVKSIEFSSDKSSKKEENITKK